MRVTLVIDEREIDLLDATLNFEAGEQVSVLDGTVGKVLRVEAVQKHVSIVGNSADPSYRVILK